MVAQGRTGGWHPRGQGLLVAVVVLSLVAVLGHGFVALTLLRGTVHPPPPTSGASSSGASPSPSGAVPASLHLDHACLVAHNPPTRATIPAGDPFGTDLADLGQGAGLQRLYAVNDRDLTPIDGAGPVRECDRQLWNLVLSATFSIERGWIKEFLVFDADTARSGSAVGEVVPAPSDPSRWRLSLAPNAGSDLDVAVTIAHELGHIITLNPAQMAAPQPATCTSFDTGLGCLDRNAYLVEYLAHTWSDTEVDEWNAAAAVDTTKRDQAFEDFYGRHRGSFVDAYAATDPEEDFAESFGLWCAVGPDNPALADLIEGDPTNGARKLAWFDHGSDNFTHSYFSYCTSLRQLTR